MVNQSKMKSIELELVDEEGNVYTENFKGYWVINPQEEMKAPNLYFGENKGYIADEGKCCAVAQKEDGALIFYVFHKSEVKEPYIVEFASIEEAELDVSDQEILETIKVRMGV